MRRERIEDAIIRWCGTILLFLGYAVLGVAVGIDKTPFHWIIGGAIGIFAWWLFDPFYQRKDKII